MEREEEKSTASLNMEDKKINNHKSFSLMWAVASCYLLLRADSVSKIYTAQIQQSKTWITSHDPLNLKMLPTPYGKGHQKKTKSGSLEYSSCPSNNQPG